MIRGYVGGAGHQLHYVRAGSGVPVILLHASPASSAMWGALLPQLEARGYAAVAFDLPGYGMSDAPQQEPTLTDYAESIAAGATELGFERFHLVGQHTGCSVALTLSATQPGRVMSIVGFGVPLLEPDAAAVLAREQTPVYDEEGRGVARKWRLYWDRSRSRTQAPTLAARTVSDMLAAGDGLPYAHRAVGRAEHRQLLRQLRAPMLCVSGTHDALRDHTVRAAREVEHSTHVEIEGAGYFVADERPEELAEVVHGFLSTRPSLRNHDERLG
ncbi:MAG: alpha/beta fold hydrolase [Solirubrobacteraceae bacterium]